MRRTALDREPVPSGVRVLVFRLSDREHALPLEDVVEVVRMVAVAPVPDAHPWVLGVVDMRGRVIPVIDLRRRLGMRPREPGLSTPIIVVGAGGRTAGLVVDDVVEVVELPTETMEPPGEAVGPAAVISSVAHGRNGLVLVLDTWSLVEGSGDLRTALEADA